MQNNLDLFDFQVTPKISRTDIELINKLQLFSEILKVYGYQVQATSPKALAKLPEISEEKKYELIKYFDNWTSWVRPEDSSSSIIQIDNERELGFLQKAIDFYEIDIDDRFMSTIGEDDVTEIYGPNMIQLYRSLRFFKYCGYSLLDISVFEWFVLWERPKLIVEKMMKDTQQIVESGQTLHKVKIPRHVLRETYNSGNTEHFIPRACVIDFQYMGSILSRKDRNPCGVIVTARGETIAEGSDALNIEFV